MRKVGCGGGGGYIVKKSLQPLPSEGMVEEAKKKKHGGFRPQRGYPGYALRPPWTAVTEDASDKAYK